MSSVSTKRAAQPSAPPGQAGDPEIGPLGFGQGALVDADILREATGLRALHAAQEQGSHFAGAQAPRALLSLFRHAARILGEPNVLPRP